MKKILTFILTFCMMFTALPFMTGNFDAHAASYWTKYKVKATGYTTTKVTWRKLTKAQQKKITGIAIYRNGKLIKMLKKTATSFSDKNLVQGKTYRYQLKTYKKTVKKNGSSKKSTYTFDNASATKRVTTKVDAVKYPTPKNLKYKVKGKKITVTWDPIENADKYIVRLSYIKSYTSTEPKFTFKCDGRGDFIEVWAVYGAVKSNKAQKELWLNGGDYDDDDTEDITPTPSGKTVKITDYTGKVRTVDKNDPEVKDPQYNRDVDGKFGENEYGWYLQRNKITFYFEHRGYDWYAVTVYNGDINKLTIESNATEYTCKVWDNQLEAPTSTEVNYIKGNHGRRLAFVDWQNSNREKKVIYNETYYDIGDVTLTTKYDGEVLENHILTLNHKNMVGEDGLLDGGRTAYQIATDAVSFYENGGSINAYPQEKYQNDIASYGKYYADMKAIEQYIRENFEYSHMDCWQGYTCLEAYSVVAYGEYGNWVNPYPQNTGHRSFRPYSYCEVGKYTSYFETNGHD